MKSRLGRRLGVAGATVGLVVAACGTAAVAAPTTPAGLTLVATRHSLLGTHAWYQQTYQGIPVLGSYYA